MPIPKRILTSGDVAIKKCKHGLFAYWVNDIYIGKSLDIYGEWTEPELTLLDNFIFPGSVVVDVGAFIGTHSVFFAQKTGKRGFVFALEPQRTAFNLLAANLALNSLYNVKCFNVAAGEKKDKALLPVLDPSSPQNFGALSIERYNQGEPIPIITIDDLDLHSCNLMKIDVEGYEAKVLKGAKKTINKFRPILYVENNREETSRATIETLLDLGYDCWWHFLEYYNPDNFFKNKKNVFEKAQLETNMVCFSKERKAKVKGTIKVSGPSDNWQKALERLQLDK